MTATAAPLEPDHVAAGSLVRRITVVSWWLAPGHPGPRRAQRADHRRGDRTLGFIKGRMIIRYFMEVRTAPRWLKTATDVWLTVLWLAILAIYLLHI